MGTRVRTRGLADLPDGTAAPDSLKALDALIQQMSFAVVSAPLAPALQGARVVRGQYGLASRRMLLPSLSRDTQRSPNFTKALFQYLTQCFPGARATSCTIAFHRSAALHTDKANIGPSYAVAMKSSSGGQLWVAQPFAVHGTVLRVTEQLCEFDPLELHTTLPFEGPRYYISYYSHRAATRVKCALRRRLMSLSVPLPSVRECAAMRRATKKRPALCHRRADGFKQWAAYLRTLSPKQRRATKASQSRMGGSWVCKSCRCFGPLLIDGGRPRHFCSRSCEHKYYRRATEKLKLQKVRACLNCGGGYRQPGGAGGQRRYCKKCRRKRPAMPNTRT